MKYYILLLLFIFYVNIYSQSYIVVTDVWEPFRIESEKELTGIDIDILEFLESETGLDFVIQKKPWARCLKNMEIGSADLMVGLAYSKERGEYIEYLNPSYFTISIGFFTSSDTIKIENFKDLEGITIGYVTGSNYFEEFDNSTNLRKISVPQESQLLQMLERGNLDAIIGTRSQIEYELKIKGWEDRIFPQNYNPTDGVRLYIGISKKSELLNHRSEIESAIEKLIKRDLKSITLKYQ